MVSEVPEQAQVAASDWAGERGRKWVQNLGATERMLEPVNAPLLDALDLSGVRSVADIGCGGGRTTRAVASRLAGNAAPAVGNRDEATLLPRVHGIDISPDVIDVASRGDALTSTKLSFFCQDAGHGSAPLADGYERLTSRFGVMFFDDPPAAFSNLASWLKPGGRFVFAVWGELDRNPWMGCLRRVIAELVELPPPVPDAPGPFRYARAGRFVELLASSGFANVQVQDWQGELALGGGLDAAATAEFALDAFSVGEMVKHDPEVMAVAAARLRDAFAPYERDGVVVTPAAVHLVNGSSGA